MFIMTSEIQIGQYKVKPHAVVWRSSVLSIIETSTISLPRVTYLQNKVNGTEDNTVKGSFVFREGDKVSVKIGYDGKNSLRFMGFVKRINQTDRLELECEGYNYQLPKVFNKSYASTTVKNILADLTLDTDIKIDESTANVKVSAVRFKNASGLQVLEWIQKELHLAVYFAYNCIYVGTLYGRRKEKKKLRAGWNTVSDKDFKQRRTDENVLIQLVDKDAKGEVKKTKSDEQKYSQTKEIKIRAGLTAELKKQIANDLQNRENYRGYEGSVLCFLEPDIEKSDVIIFEDRRFPERSGEFFAETVEGRFDSSGGRQNVTLNYFGYGNSK